MRFVEEIVLKVCGIWRFPTRIESTYGNGRNRNCDEYERECWSKGSGRCDEVDVTMNLLFKKDSETSGGCVGL